MGSKEGVSSSANADFVLVPLESEGQSRTRGV